LQPGYRPGRSEEKIPVEDDDKEDLREYLIREEYKKGPR
jgi:hypothetical protein